MLVAPQTAKSEGVRVITARSQFENKILFDQAVRLTRTAWARAEVVRWPGGAERWSGVAEHVASSMTRAPAPPP